MQRSTPSWSTFRLVCEWFYSSVVSEILTTYLQTRIAETLSSCSDRWPQASTQRRRKNHLWKVSAISFPCEIHDALHELPRYFPPGTQIYVPAYPLQRDPRYFDQPNDFIPERWIGYPTSSSLAISWNHSAAAPLTLGTPTASPTSLIGTTSIPVPRPSSPYTAYTPSPFTNARIIKDPLAYIPFSYGPANCVGKMLAKREILMVIPTLMRRFELEFADKDGAWRDQWVNDLPDHFITTKIPLLMRLVLRDGKREASLPP